MTKKLFNIILVIIILGVVVVIVFTEISKKNDTPEFLLGKPFIGSIKVEKRINGNIMPAEEIKVKSKINGIIEKVYVEVGDTVKKGQRIAVVRNLTEPMDIETLKSSVQLLEIQKLTIKKSYEREKKLCSQGLSTQVEFEKAETEYNEILEKLVSAKKRLQMATSGVTTSDKEMSNIIYAPIAGTVLSLWGKQGAPVIKQNNFNEGTTVATIANMDSLKFFGELSERELTNVFIGQEIEVETIFSEKENIKAFVDKIHPKGKNNNGIVTFPFEANITNNKKKFFGGINAVAVITTASRENVLCINEKYLFYENDTCYVLARNKDKFLKSSITCGISDGVITELKQGLDSNSVVKLPVLN